MARAPWNDRHGAVDSCGNEPTENFGEWATFTECAEEPQSGTGSAGKTGPPEMSKDTRYSPACTKIRVRSANRVFTLMV
jgi:hypothetical protein